MTILFKIADYREGILKTNKQQNNYLNKNIIVKQLFEQEYNCSNNCLSTKTIII